MKLCTKSSRAYWRGSSSLGRRLHVGTLFFAVAEEQQPSFGLLEVQHVSRMAPRVIRVTQVLFFFDSLLATNVLLVIGEFLLRDSTDDDKIRY